MANTLTMKWQDAFGAFLTTSCDIDPAYDIGDTEVAAFLQAMRNMTQAKLIEASIAKKIDITGLTNGAPASAGSFDRVNDQAALQLLVTGSGAVKQVTVPAPLDTIFTQTGAYAFQEVDPADSLVLAFVAAGVTEPILVSAEGGAVTYRKGWRRGQKHP